MSITVNYNVTPFLITIPKSDLAIESGTKYQLDVNIFWGLLRDYADNEEGMVFPVIYSRIAATASTPSITEVNENYYQLQFEDGAYSVNIVNGNTNIRNVEVKNQVSVNTNNTTGFIDPVFLQYGTFDGGVTIDVLNGRAGTAYPIGTPGTPVNNILDAQIIANDKGFTNLYVKGDLTLTSDAYLVNFTVIGQNAQNSRVVVNADAVVSNTEFKECSLTGDLDGGSVLRSGVAFDLNYINGYLFEVMIEGTLKLGGNKAAYMFKCFSGTPGQGTPTIDMGGSGQSLALRGYNGGIKLINKSGPEAVSLDFASGQAILDSTVTDGEIVIRGVAKVTDNSTGTTVVYDETVSGSATEHFNAIQANLTNVLDIITLIRKFDSNRTKIDKTLFTLTVYDDDNTTPLHTFDLKDAAGLASFEEIFERVIA